MLKNLVKSSLSMLGYKLSRTDEYMPDMADIDTEQDFLPIYEQCKSYTMTSKARLFAVYQAVKYVSQNNIPGDLAECGVWRGGSCMAAALTLLSLNDTSRKIYLYDTFEGMPSPNEKDVNFKGRHASNVLNDVGLSTMSEWCHASIEDVRQNMCSTGYPEQLLSFVQGKVQETIPTVTPQQIAFLRLDTDWYESTAHEMKYLYPRLHESGVAIFDDYGHWQGHRKAIDEYFDVEGVFPLVTRIDGYASMMIKTRAA